jgi:FkbM family methyltransferase
MTQTTFLQEFTQEVCASIRNDYGDNLDEERFGPLPRATLSDRVKQLVKDALRKRKYQDMDLVEPGVRRALEQIVPHAAEFERLKGMLADEESRTLLVKLMAFRAMGHRKVKLPFNTPEMHAAYTRILGLASKNGTHKTVLGWTLSEFDLASLSIPVKLHTVPAGAFTIFDRQQYRCDCRPKPIEAAPGDYVIDAGGCWGDTALYFANRIGEAGRVFTFEFVPKNLEVMQANLALNPALAGRIEIVNHAVWSKSGETLTYNENGPGTNVARLTGTEASVLTLTIDDLTKQRDVPKVGFIKMDVEGAEMAALRGAEATLRRDRPKLAICVYHSLSDFLDVPDYLASLGLGYRFYLRHFTIHAEETVLYAIADRA